MSALVARLLWWHRELAIEVQRFVLLWRYQHQGEAGGVRVVTLGWRLAIKQVVDVIGAAIGLVVTAPVLVAAAAAVKVTSRGAVIYRQERVGHFGEPFMMYKFRTMRVDAEADGPKWWAGEDDPRMTRVGAFLRRTHIDELPQLWNVLKGEMSLVGPRPERPHFVEQLNQVVHRYDDRLLVKPGVTGLAQVHYRYDQSVADVRRKLRFDQLYVRRLCLALDARILAWTLMVVITGRGIR